MMSKKQKQFLILIDGHMGAGKSTLAEALKKKLPRTGIVSLDRIKTSISDYNKSPEDISIAARVGAQVTKAFFKEGMSVLVEKAFTEHKWLASFLKDVRPGTIPVYVYQLECSLPVAWERVKERQKDKPKKRQQPKSKVVRNHTNFIKGRYASATVFNTEKISTAKMVKHILSDIGHG